MPLALLAGDVERAEREARLGVETLTSVGGAAIQAPLLAEALLAAGRTDDADAALTAVDAERTPNLVPWQVKWRIARARILSRRGEDGQELAREAVALAEHGDDLNLEAEALTAFAETLELAGTGGAAAEARERAAAAFERKGNVVAARAASVSPAGSGQGH